MRLVDNNGQYRITIPKDLVKDRGWKAGTQLRFVEDVDGRVFLKEIDKSDS